ncbi:hypothetical protein SDC9_89424 [bioreactor metagenome]|uniref:Uncharacterized protein n=1 Tax=bioreactor metagenome TaxID=1076179 RepID=A0A644ZVU8_9ZZZZ
MRPAFFAIIFQGVRPEGIRIDDVAAGFIISPVQRRNSIRMQQIPKLRELPRGKPHGLKQGAGSAVQIDEPGPQLFTNGHIFLLIKKLAFSHCLKRQFSFLQVGHPVCTAVQPLFPTPTMADTDLRGVISSAPVSVIPALRGASSRLSSGRCA